MSWFDTDREFNLASIMSENTIKLKDGLGEKLAAVANMLGTFMFSVCTALTIGWELSLACAVVMPLSLGVSIALANYQTKSTTREMGAYSQAGKHAQEVLKSVKTVVAFGGESMEVWHGALLLPAEHHAHKRGLLNGLGTGFAWVLVYCVTAIAISYGTRLAIRDVDKPAEEQKYVFGSIYSINLNLFAATQLLSMCLPHFEVFATARGAAANIFQIINRVPTICNCDKKGISPRKAAGEINVVNVHFSYTSRPDVKILKNFSIRIKPGECVALVGPSGCGKTTLLQLLQRLYEPSSGAVKLDGNDLVTLDLSWLRSIFGVVGQEPVLFSGTVFENIAIGCPQATPRDVQRVAKMANAHGFIQNLPKGYDTVIGERGASLSGGQKQRVAIARSLLRDPAVLLLDEPTSALDPHAELQVQAALDRASAGRTTVVVSHRLSTIVKADRIICMDKGAVVEQGTHEELMRAKGFYHRLVTIEDHDREKRSAYEEITPSAEEVREDQKDTETAKTMSKCKSWRTSQASHSSTTTDSPEDVDEVVSEVSGWQMLKLNAPEWKYITVGSVAAFTQGSCFSIIGLLTGYTSAIFVLDDPAQMLHLADLYACLFLAVAGAAGLCMCLQGWALTTAGLRLTSRLRIQYLTALLNQEIGFHDKQSNTVGALCSRLSGDTAAVQNATGLKVGIVLQGVSSVLVGVGMGLFFDWRLTLVLTALLPLIVGSTWLEGRMSQKSQVHERRAMEAATSVATEAIISVTTVQSLGIETIFLQKFDKSIREACSALEGAAYWRGLTMGVGLCAPLAACCGCFCYGATLVAGGSLEYKVILLVTESVVFGSFMLGQSLIYTSSFNKVNLSAGRILSVINREPLVRTNVGVPDDSNWIATGNLTFNAVKFTYPTRKKEVLRGIDLNVDAGQTVALVGPSGCGKSTILQLMQRFYDPDSGTIIIDGRDVRCALSVARLRGALGVVQQEPTLFDRSLADNVAYGDTRRRVPMSEIVAACQTTNIHAFIASLPNGYATRLGAGGAQLSGGQKQRVCIARALVRAPRLLLLDEATSALDAASERVVSEALHRAAEGRTCVTIAHRLSTIEHADVIFVLREGNIVERGNHKELMRIRGLYYRMYKQQKGQNRA